MVDYDEYIRCSLNICKYTLFLLGECCLCSHYYSSFYEVLVDHSLLYSNINCPTKKTSNTPTSMIAILIPDLIWWINK